MTSEFGGNSRAWERLEKSWVVDGPMAGWMMSISAGSRRCLCRELILISSTSAFMKLAAASIPALNRSVVCLATWYVAPSWTLVDLR